MEGIAPRDESVDQFLELLRDPFRNAVRLNPSIRCQAQADLT